MGLYIRPVRLEKFLGTINRKLFGDIDILTTTVIALAGIPFRILVGQDPPPTIVTPLQCISIDLLNSVLLKGNVMALTSSC